MRLRPLVGSLLLAFMAMGLAACGGPSDPAPGPLSRHFEDTFLAQVPLDQRKDEIAAKQAYDIAMLEKAKAEADYNESRVQLERTSDRDREAVRTVGRACTRTRRSRACRRTSACRISSSSE